MFSSYFFLPADKKKFIDKTDSLEATNFIFDLEESVYYGNIDICIENLSNIIVKNNYSVRFPVNYKNPQITKDALLKLYNIGFRTFVLPKIETTDDLKNIIEFNNLIGLKQVKYAIIVESPIALLNIELLIRLGKENIDYILIGSHDYCNIIGCKHTLDNLLYLRLKILAVCKAFKIPIIDIVSTQTQNVDEFTMECISAFNMGFDGKAIIHPMQLDVLNSALYYSKMEVQEAKYVHEQLKKSDMNKFSIIKINGNIYEKPHLKRIFDIIEWNKKKNYYGI